MINRRRALLLGLAVLPSVLLPGMVAQAQRFQRFVPLLVDLDGWKGDKADGMSMQMPGNDVDTAARKYRRGGATIDAQIIVGPAAQGALAMTQTGMKIETGDARMSTSNIDGVMVTRVYTISTKSGQILVPLANNAIFSVTFNGISDDEALAQARKFSWKAMQAQVK